MALPAAVHAASWSGHDTVLLELCTGTLLAIVLLIAVVRLPPFLAILVGSLGFALGAGIPFAAAVHGFEVGAGSLLGQIGLVLALGAILGGLIQHSGAAARLVRALLRTPFGRGAALPWTVAAAAAAVGLPLFFEVGLVIMLPIILLAARESGMPVLRVAIPAMAGMTVLHALVPPHPGPLIAIAALHAGLGPTLGLGLLLAVPAVVLAGPLYGNWLSRRPRYDMHELTAGVAAPHGTGAAPESASGATPGAASAGVPPGLATSMLALLLPVLLMLGRTVATLLPPGPAVGILEVIGEPVPALALSVLCALPLLRPALHRGRVAAGDAMARALPPIAALLLTIGAGGGLKQELLDAGIGRVVALAASTLPLSLPVLGWTVAALLRQATGSATVATTAAAGLLAPTLLAPTLLAVPGASAGGHGLAAPLLCLAIGAGSVFFCQLNDAAFWMVNQFFGLDLRQTVMSWSVLQSIVSLCAGICCAALWPWLG